MHHFLQSPPGHYDLSLRVLLTSYRKR